MNCEFRHPLPCANEAVVKEMGRWMCRPCYDDLNVGMMLVEMGNAFAFLNGLDLSRLSDTQAVELNDALSMHVDNIQALQTKIRREYIRRAEVA